MTALNWPENIYPVRQVFYIRPNTGRFASALTGQVQVLDRDVSRWVAVLDFRLNKEKAAVFEALLAKLRGPAGTVLVPDFRRVNKRIVTQSMDDYAAQIGVTFFDDGYDFDDMTQDDGFLATEEPVPLETEENMELGGLGDALLEFPDAVTLLTEAGDDLFAENVGIPFITETGGLILTMEHGEPLEIGLEEGFTFETEAGEQIVVQVGGGFFEGAGQPKLVGGILDKITIDGLAPFTISALLAGEAINTSPGRVHLVLFDVDTNINGYGKTIVAPKIREPIIVQSLATGDIKVLMRLLDDEAGRNDTVPPAISSYQLRLEEVLP